jgi:hypothetical protein
MLAHLIEQPMLDHLPPGTPPTGPDGPVAVLERRIADLLGTPSALFFPTGAMAQQVALRVHAGRRGRSRSPRTRRTTSCSGSSRVSAPCTGCATSRRATRTGC